MSTVNAVIRKKIYGSEAAAFIVPNYEMEDIRRIVKSLEESGLFIK